jgi:DNA primase
MIPQEIIEQVREATDIVQIVSEYIRLKKKGRDMWACCPFHKEKTASFKVSTDRQLFHCFGCGKGGNVFTFLMEHEAMSFIEAVRHLAQRANIQIRETGSDHRRDRLERLNYAHEIAEEYFHGLLIDPKYKTVLRDYLMDRRGITELSIKTFKLGLSGEDWDGLITFAARKDIGPEELHEAGLISRKESTGRYFDRFRQRLMIPIYNLSGKPIAFGGRTLKKGEPAKYINSPETPLYNKSRVLYGLNFAKDAIRSTKTVYVVEGYFDLISLHQHGIRNVVASSGTAFTPQQAQLLARFAEKVLLFFDADSAGRQAALRSVDSLYDSGLDVKVISAPQGEDPDSLAREQGVERIEELRDEALPYIDFRIRQTDLSQAGIIEREKLAKEFAALAQRIADPTRRGLFLQEAAQQLGINQSVLVTAMAAERTESGTSAAARVRFHAHEFELLSLLLLKPGIIDFVFEAVSPDDFDSKLLARVYAAMMTQYAKDSDLNVHRLIENAPADEFGAVVSEMAARDWPADDINNQVKLVVTEFVNRKLATVRTRLREALRKAEASGDRDRADGLILEMKQYGLW